MYTSNQFGRTEKLFRQLKQVEQEPAADDNGNIYYTTFGYADRTLALEYVTYGELSQPFDYFRVRSPLGGNKMIVVLRNPAFYKRRATEVVLVGNPRGAVATKSLLEQYLNEWGRRRQL